MSGEESKQNQEESMSNKFLMDLLSKADKRITEQSLMIEKLNDGQTRLRDLCAMNLYPHFIEKFSDYEQAAAEAVRASEVLMRMKDGGIEHQFTTNPNPESETEKTE